MIAQLLLALAVTAAARHGSFNQDQETTVPSVTSPISGSSTTYFAQTYQSDAPAVVSTTPTTTAASTVIPPSSASSIDASVSTQMSYALTSDAIPLPTYIKSYNQLTQLASMMPPLAMSSTGPSGASRRRVATDFKREADDWLAHLRPPPPEVIPLHDQLKSLGYPETDNHHNLTKTKRDGPLRVMIVGDSMTHGAEGDFTWRYRMWQWFTQQHPNFQFVGPYIGTQDALVPSAPKPPPLYDPNGSSTSSNTLHTNGGYDRRCDPGFIGHSSHFSVWGRALAVDQYLIKQVLTDNPADMILLMLGFNDVGWFYSDGYGTMESLKLFLSNARAANPNIKIAVANIPQRTWLGRPDLPAKTNTYNTLLQNAIPNLQTSTSQVELVHLQETYNCGVSSCPAGYDGLHPNAYGDFMIANAFSTTLVNKFGLGTTPLAIPDPATIPQKDQSPITGFSVVASPGGVTATWDAKYGVIGYEVRSRIEGVTDWVSGQTNTARYDLAWTLDGFKYSVSVRSNSGLFNNVPQVSEWTDPITVTAHPQTAPGPANVRTVATATGVDVYFDPPTGPFTDSIFEYYIIFWDMDTQCEFLGGAGFRSNAPQPLHIDGLKVGHRYLIAPTTWNSAGGGFPEIVRNVRIGDLGTPAVPSNVQVVPINAAAAHITWTEQPDAAGYTIWASDSYANTSLSPIGGAGSACADGYFLFPGVQYFTFCVSAYNGNKDSGLSQCVTAKAPSNGAPTGPTCPAPAPWCPGFGQASTPPSSAGQGCETADGGIGACPASTGDGSSGSGSSGSGSSGNGSSGNGTSGSSGSDNSTAPDPSIYYEVNPIDCDEADVDEPICYIPVDFSYPDCNGNYADLDAVENDQNNIPSECLQIYLLQAMSSMLQQAYDNYTSILSDDYDQKFQDYSKYILEIGPYKMNEVVNSEMPAYFTCTYLVTDNHGGSYYNLTGRTCPSKPADLTEESRIEGHQLEEYWYILRDSDGFYQRLSSDYGIVQDWVEFGAYPEAVPCHGQTVGPPVAHCGGMYPQNVPIFNSSAVVPDPRQAISQSIKSAPDTINWMQSIVANAIALGPLQPAASVEAAVDAFSLVVLQTQGAVSDMNNVVDVGDQIEEEERKNKIALIVESFLSALLLVIPGLGEALDAVLDTALIARIATMVSEFGNIGFTVYGIVQDPKSAPMAVFGAVLGGLPSRDLLSINKASWARRSVSNDADDIKGLGDVVTNGVAQIDRISFKDGKFCAL